MRVRSGSYDPCDSRGHSKAKRRIDGSLTDSSSTEEERVLEASQDSYASSDHSTSAAASSARSGGRRFRAMTVAFSDLPLQQSPGGAPPGALTSSSSNVTFGRAGSGSGDEDDDADMASLHMHAMRQLSCLPSEEIAIQTMDQDRVRILFAGEERPKLGRLYLTTYRLVFITQSAEQFFVPLGNIERVEKVGGKRSKQAHSYRLVIECKDFRRFALVFDPKSSTRRNICTFMRDRLSSKLDIPSFFAFTYTGEGFTEDGWLVYDPIKDYERMGVPDGRWRITRINQNFELCDTYPRILCCPTDVTDDQLRRVAAFRSRGRLPAVVWKSQRNDAVLVRCAQPLVGLKRARSRDDEAYMQALLDANPQCTTLPFLDARPKANAVANKAKGGGTEIVSHYKHCTLAFMNIGNIHVMRDSLARLKEVVFSESDGSESKWFSALEASGWMSHVYTVLSSSCEMVNLMHRGTSVVCHCSDGWDRTAQMSSIAQMMLDPYYRTLIGFEALIEKEWVSFGYQFSLRMGNGRKDAKEQKESQRSPVFLQWLDAVYQIISHFSTSFEFDERLLLFLAEESFSCRFGTFLCDSERERAQLGVRDNTFSIWSYVNSNKSMFVNRAYIPCEGPRDPAAVLLMNPAPCQLRFWQRFYLRYIPKLRPQPSAMEYLSYRLDEQDARIAALEAELEGLRSGKKDATG